MDAAFRQGLDESPFVEAFYVWSSAARERAGTMFVYNRDSLADVSGDLDLRFRERTRGRGGGAAAAAAAAGAQAGDRRLPGDHRRAQEVRPGAAALPQPRPGADLELRRPGGRRRRPAPDAPAGADERPAGHRAAPRRLSAARSHAARSGRAGDLLVGAAGRLGLRGRAQLPAGVLRPRAAGVHRPLRGRTRDLDAADRLRRPHHRRDRRGQQPAAAGADVDPGAGDGRRRALRRRRRGPRSAGGRVEVELRRLGLARPEDAAGADPAVRRDPGAGPGPHAGPGRRVLPDHQRRGQEADPPDREHPRLLADGSRPAALPGGPGRPRRGHRRRRPPDAQRRSSRAASP